MTALLNKILALERSKKLLILVGTVAFLLAVYLWLFLVPLYNEMGSLNGTLTKLLNQKGEQEAIVEDLELFKAEYLRLQEALNTVIAQLPNKKEIPSLLENISNLGRECGLELTLFKPDKEVPKDFYAEVPVDIKLVGGFPDIATFFYRIAKLPRIVTISTIEITIPKDKQAGPLLDAACRATTYRFLEKDERQESTKPQKKRGGGSAAEGAETPIEKGRTGEKGTP